MIANFVTVNPFWWVLFWGICKSVQSIHSFQFLCKEVLCSLGLVVSNLHSCLSFFVSSDLLIDTIRFHLYDGKGMAHSRVTSTLNFWLVFILEPK